MNNPLVSVIIPVYNTKKYLKRCLDSVLNQVYKNIEIIIVDDASTDGSIDIEKEYSKKYDSIKVIYNNTNQGLFQTRINGVEKAKGDYIAFVDSDDYVDVDWFYSLIDSALTNSADIVAGDTILDFWIKKSYYNLDLFRLNNFNLNEKQIIYEFLKSEGKFYLWWTMWNKIYSRKLFEKCISKLKSFSQEKGHILMCEDVIFTSYLYLNAEKFVNVHNAYYYYYKGNVNAAIVTEIRSKERFEKHVSDYLKCYEFINSVYNDDVIENLFPQDYDIKRNLASFKKSLISQMYGRVSNVKFFSEYESKIRESFSFYDKFEPFRSNFYLLYTELGSEFDDFEQIKQNICSSRTEFVSFDVFDTLILRPLFVPSDLFSFLDELANENLNAYVEFRRIRIAAEKSIEEKKKAEVTLDEIYSEIGLITGFKDEKLEVIKQAEINLEYKLCYVRETGKRLYELAKYAGKKIIICSDMYLPTYVIANILEKNGYTGWEKIYVSAEKMKTKYNGTLYDLICEELDVKDKSSMLHIGDNEFSDVKQAESKGIKTGYLPNTVDVFTNKVQRIYGGSLYKHICLNLDSTSNNYVLNSYVPARCMLGNIANKLFDNPFISFNRESDFNGSPAYIGYVALGPHLLALVKWLKRQAEKLNVGTVHFVSRDGYLPKKAFDLINNTKVKSNYIRLSRESLLLADVKCPEDFVSLRNKIPIATVRKLIKYVNLAIPEEKQLLAEKILLQNGFLLDFKLTEDSDFYRCLRVIASELVDYSLLDLYRMKLRSYFLEIIKPGDFIFDIGYSGRTETTLSSLLGFSVGSFYLHDNKDLADKRRSLYGIKNDNFYHYFTPEVMIIREHVLMEPAPQTIGYEEVNGKFEPVLGEFETDYFKDSVIKIIQNNALDYIKDMQSRFGEYFDEATFNSDSQREGIPSAVFDYYIFYSKPFDRQIFKSSVFDDPVGVGDISVLDSWNSVTLTFNSSEINPKILKVITKLYRVANKLLPYGSLRRKFVKLCLKILYKIMKKIYHLFKR